MFVDRILIKVTAGTGGNGCMSFRREKFVRFGGPDGGDGGNGGNVYFEAVNGERNLNAIKYKNHYEAKRGEHGMGKQRHGKSAADITIKLPPGTIIRDPETGVTVFDLDKPGSRFLAAQGGRGGKGNMHFATSTNQAPRKTTEPTEGECREYELELKTIADIGLVGYPNAGKSTLISFVSNAHPETAPYPFTTLYPNVGVIDCGDYFRMTMADIPGLIEGAHANVGLGHDFLRHIERTKVLVYVLDLSGIDGREPWEDLQHLQEELELYQEGLSARGTLIAANKTDEAGSAENLEILKSKTDLPIFPICAVLGEGCDALIDDLRERVAPIQLKEEYTLHHPEAEEQT